MTQDTLLAIGRVALVLTISAAFYYIKPRVLAWYAKRNLQKQSANDENISMNDIMATNPINNIITHCEPRDNLTIH